jgi:undecaprenyl-diphosphatase
MSRFAYWLQRALAYWNRLQRPEIWILAALVFSAALCWGFAELADEVLEGETTSLDERLLLALRSTTDPADPIGPQWFEELGRDFTALGGAGVLSLLSASVVLFLWLVPMHRAAIYVAASAAGAIALSLAAKAAFARPRPDLVPHGSYVYTSSFPSGHSMMAAAVYLTLGLLIAQFVNRRRLRVYCVVVAALVTLGVGASRVYLGVHWPSDVLAGWCIGAAWAMVCWLIATWLQKRGAIEQENSGSTE